MRNSIEELHGTDIRTKSVPILFHAVYSHPISKSTGLLASWIVAKIVVFVTFCCTLNGVTSSTELPIIDAEVYMLFLILFFILCWKPKLV